jgi:predicted acyltransferase
VPTKDEIPSHAAECKVTPSNDEAGKREPGASVAPVRLVSLDAYRGFIMLAMASGGFGFAKVAQSRAEATASSRVWDVLAYQFDHVPWTGCAFWDLIQPAFMFMVGVALPFSVANRRARGDSLTKILSHAAYRSALLVMLGVFLSSNLSKQTNWTFVNVLSQIGLGYLFLYAVLGRGLAVQLGVVALILGGYWLAFYLHPLPPDDFDWKTAGVSDDWEPLRGMAGHWNKNYNLAASFDRWFLNLFPRAKPHRFNEGGYQTLNFVPSLATMMMGVMAGELLQSARAPRRKRNLLFAWGALCLVLGLAVDHTIWPERLMGVADTLVWSVVNPAAGPMNPEWSLCPIVKRIWTPSWAVFSTGWTLWMLAAFYWLIDVEGYRRWSLGFVVIGTNSIAAYCMSQLLKPWLRDTLKIHFGNEIFDGAYFGVRLFHRDVRPVAESLAFLLFLWLVCWWMHRHRLFLRI